jgi:hypothetical protein
MKTIAPGKAYVPLYKRWWFWALVACGVVATWQAVLYFNWQGDMTKYQIRNAVADAYMQREQDKADALEAAYKADTYGGATPEETLKLFIDALEKKDYELASKYFVVEEQEENVRRAPEGVQSGGFTTLISAYRTGTLKIDISKDSDQAEINIYPKGDNIGFIFRAKVNPFTKVWKLTDK